jgi:hypothetical protein
VRAKKTSRAFNSTAKPTVGRRTPARKRDQIRKYAELYGLNYSEAEERLLDRGLAAESDLASVSPEVEALFFGRLDDDGAPPVEPGRRGSLFATWDDLESEWQEWRDRIEPPHDSWWAFWRVDKSLSADEAQRRAEAARDARVTPKAGLAGFRSPKR